MLVQLQALLISLVLVLPSCLSKHSIIPTLLFGKTFVTTNVNHRRQDIIMLLERTFCPGGKSVQQIS